MRTGRQEPTFSSSLSYAKTLGPECAAFCEAAGLHLMPWQRSLLDRWLAVDDAGLWVSATVGAEIPRQQGKSEGLNLARVAYGLVVLGENIAFTSHRSDAEREFFEALRKFLCQPCFRHYVTEDDFHAAVGRETLRMKAGNKIEFMARSNKSGRSKHADLIIFDEAQFLTSSQKASILPTTLTRPNMQTISTGTPPEYDNDGMEFRALRKRGETGERYVCWDEWSLGKVPDDVADRDLWYEVMPSLGRIIGERNVEILLGDMGPVDFARELLGVWVTGRTLEPAAIDPEAWDACETDEPPKGGIVGCGVKFSADGSTYSVSVAAKQKDGSALVECIDRAPTSHGVSELAHWIQQRKDRFATVCIDGQEWAPTLTQRLSDLGFPKKAVQVMRAHDLADACSMLGNAVGEKSVCHIAQPLLRASVEASTKRAIGGCGWGFGGPDPTPIESVAMAYWGAMTTKRNPARKGRINV